MNSTFFLFCSSGLTAKLEESVLRDRIRPVEAPAPLAKQIPTNRFLQRRDRSRLVVALAQDLMQIFHRDRIFCLESPGSATEGFVYVIVRVASEKTLN